MNSEVVKKKPRKATRKLKLSVTDTPQTLPYGHNRGSALIMPTDYDSMKTKAVKAMFEHAEIQLMPLQEQLSFLVGKKDNLLLLPADDSPHAVASNQASLALIDEQVDLIKNQVRGIQEKYLISLEVLKAKFSFVPVHGETYYLYQKNEERILMLIGPHQWQLGENTLYVATVKLMADASWQVLEINEQIDMDFTALQNKKE